MKQKNIFDSMTTTYLGIDQNDMNPKKKSEVYKFLIGNQLLSNLKVV